MTGHRTQDTGHRTQAILLCIPVTIQSFSITSTPEHFLVFEPRTHIAPLEGVYGLLLLQLRTLVLGNTPGLGGTVICHYHIPINDLLDFNSKILPEKSEIFSRTPPC